MRYPVQKKTFACKYCGKYFLSKVGLNKHIENYDPNGICRNTEPYQCDICRKIVYSRDSLKLHKIRHIRGKPFECILCKKNFRDIKILRRHDKNCMKRMNKEEHEDVSITFTNVKRQCECPKCKKSLCSIRSLRAHMNSCNGEKKFHCKICFQSFKTKVRMQEHKCKKECVKCDKYVTNEWCKEVHMKSCSGRKKFHCQKCPKSFVDINGLKMHNCVVPRN